jgi:hypothetical protein
MNAGGDLMVIRYKGTQSGMGGYFFLELEYFNLEVILKE